MDCEQGIIDDFHATLPFCDVVRLRKLLALPPSNHNVVPTCLPAGHIGIGPAAATRVTSRFKSIRFGLMVGVGGGVPSAESDIRLGDVVISQPYKQHGGGHMIRTGSLNAPHIVLLNGVSKLRANHYRGRSNLATHLSTFDRLPRFSRDTEGVTIHYGIITSGNQVMKDQVTRNRLNAELDGVLCFQMKAAGLMNDFPCLVIRGICDYADSHKNKAWQPYVAATTAACAKEILSIIPTTGVAQDGDSQRDS
ncbi:purine and uridine phosphorylase [Zopfia rhizophila CBS 207.26]|uniref:Purine and uridine phosphorylase n=1 Tax=Zopfia rhizophila CBS 207.26 TaxID=1314779 RepID=A0A6A6EKL0_9PEZI|nr:purine and uridine phosphorylase [Zopfia rhizophila CBS 207.26]